jgi:hypothetical protein
MKLSGLFFSACVAVFSSALSGQPISATLVGSNYWIDLDGAKGAALQRYLEKSGMQLVRIGGNGYNKAWPGDEKVARWVDAIRANGAEPLIQVSALQTAEQVAATVRFFNGQPETRKPVKLWSVGNEPDLDKWPTERTHKYVLELAAAMKAVDATIEIFAPDLAGPHFEHLDRLVGGDLDITAAKRGGVYLIDGISWHRYAFWKNYTREEAMTRTGPAFAEPIRKLRELMKAADKKNGRAGGQALKWSLGEFNINVAIKPADAPELYQAVEGIGVNSFFNGQFFAEIYGLCMAEQASYATSWSIHESDGNRGATDFGLFDGAGTAPVPRASFYHTMLVARYFSGVYLPVAHKVDNLVAYAAFDAKAERLSLMILNKDTVRSRVLRLSCLNDEQWGKDKVVNLPQGSSALMIALPADAPRSLGGERTDVEVPSQSTMVLVYDLRGRLRQQVRYSLEKAVDNLPPVLTDFGSEWSGKAK